MWSCFVEGLKYGFIVLGCIAGVIFIIGAFMVAYAAIQSSYGLLVSLLFVAICIVLIFGVANVIDNK